MKRTGFLRFCYIFIAVFLILSCNERNELATRAERLADLECRAINLRNERFKLANEIRFANDTLLQQNAAKDSVRLNKELVDFADQKEMLLQQSNSLADTIHKELESIRKDVLKNADDQKAFDENLKAAIEKRGCIQ